MAKDLTVFDIMEALSKGRILIHKTTPNLWVKATDEGLKQSSGYGDDVWIWNEIVFDNPKMWRIKGE